MSTETQKLPQTPDEIRAKIVEQFEQFKPHLQSYHDYAERVSALSIEYHAAKLKQQGVAVEEMTLVGTLDARETPKSLDTKLAQLHEQGVLLKRVIFDRTKSTYYLFV